MNKNRRKYLRMTAINTDCILTIDGQKYEAVSVNESIGGIAIHFSSPGPIAMNQPVEIETGGEVIRGLCRSVNRLGNEDYQLGVLRTKLR